jgi:hypothetical protein
MSLKAIHIRDLRLRNNAGINFPVCAAEEHLLDLNKSLWTLTTDTNQATCKACKKAFVKRYPWA